MLYPDMNLQKRTQQNTTRYRTALYLRLSREDGDKTESDSIANQRTLLEAYVIDHPELCIVDEFVDDGYSGSNFERPAFQNLFRELEQGTINCILVKDLSRFGRNYIEVGRYLEHIFPVMRVRLIAVTDNYDSQSAWKTSDSIMMINGIQFIQALLEANELAVGKDHQFKGRYEAEKNAVIISLEKDEREW